MCGVCLEVFGLRNKRRSRLTILSACYKLAQAPTNVKPC